MAKKEKMGKVLPFPNRPRPAAKDPLEGNDAVRVLDKKACLSLLGIVANVPADLARVLDVPPKLYSVGEGPSISSDPEKDLSDIAFKLVANQELKSEMLAEAPDYAIYITYRSSSSFCLLLDKRRKIMVFEGLGNALGGGLSWGPFIDAVDDAVKSRDELKKRGEKFDLILSEELMIKRIVV